MSLESTDPGPLKAAVVTEVLSGNQTARPPPLTPPEPTEKPRSQSERLSSSSGGGHGGDLSQEGAGSRGVGRCLGKAGTEERGRNKLREMGRVLAITGGRS